MNKRRLGVLAALSVVVASAVFASAAVSAEAPATVDFAKSLGWHGLTDVRRGTRRHREPDRSRRREGHRDRHRARARPLRSMAGTKLTQLKDSAIAFVNALDASDGSDNGTLARGNKVGIVTYKGNNVASAATSPVALTDSESSLLGALSIPPLATPGGAHTTRGSSEPLRIWPPVATRRRRWCSSPMP